MYVPVLEHTSHIKPVLSAFEAFSHVQIYEDATVSFTYGGLIFTSQRAVEAFASALDHLSSIADSGSKSERLIMQCLEHLTIPLYAVGPATALSLNHVMERFLPRCRISGGEAAGTGEILAEVILEDYNASYAESITGEMTETEVIRVKKPLLFLTGAKHRDIIPVTLTSAPSEQRIDVQEVTVYTSNEAPYFASSLATALSVTASAPVRWVVVFSPTGVDRLLSTLGWRVDRHMTGIGPDDPKWVLRESLPDNSNWVVRHTFIASIGPTTRDFMKKKLDFEVDVCAERPSPEGVWQGIEDYMRTRRGLP
ncbi:MAG: hypothetical protein LQ346_003553 [Caloplaca aetnensis]|nr:MAG: hypothetical protein LQ346_003553 [Caloplaca aetnensis]